MPWLYAELLEVPAMVKLAGHLDQLGSRRPPAASSFCARPPRPMTSSCTWNGIPIFTFTWFNSLEMPSSPRWCATYEKLNECRG